MFTAVISLKFKIVVFVLILALLLPHFLVLGQKIIYQLFQQGMGFILKQQTKNYEMLTSPNFILKYTPDDQDLAPLILPLAEDYLFRIEKILGLKQQKRPIPLVLYGEEDTFNQSFLCSGDKSAVGVYWAGTIRLLSPRVWSEKTSALRETFEREGPLAHELTHLFIDEATRGNYPRWLTEGLAQYMEEKISGFTLSEPLEENKAQLYPFSSLEKNFDQQPDQLLAYWQSLQAVRNLLEKYGREPLLALLAELRQAKNFSNAFAHSYGFAFTAFEQEFKESGWQ